MLRTQVNNWKLIETNHARLYGNFEINNGEFEVSQATNAVDYLQLERSRSFGLLVDSEGSKKMQKVFFIFSQLAFDNLELFVANAFQLFIFRRYTAIESLNEMEDHLFMTVFRFWMPYLVVASMVYLVICGVIINYIASNMTKPFLELSQRIRLNVKNMQKKKREQEREEKSGQKKKQNLIEL